MIEAFIGVIIATTASLSLLVAIGLNEKAIKDSKEKPLTKIEIQMIRKAGYTIEEIESLKIDLKEINL